ncbi:MAG TPA: hypothetical protein VM535_00420 [Candidatus Saccharimonadales bacterium]|nr:hypothetical protein [Candidatus Saccharimonadales bacterium]
MNYKKILIVGVSVLVLAIAALWTYRYLTSGTITVVSANANDTVIVSEVVTGQSKNASKIKEGTRKLKVRVPAGQYEVTVASQMSAVKKVISIEKRQRVSINLNPPAVITPEDVLGAGASSVAADATQLFFIDTSTKFLTRVDAANNRQVLNDKNQFVSAQWVSAGNGAALSRDSKLFAITNGVLAEIALPFSTTYEDETQTAFAMAPNGQLYVSHGHDVYVRAGAGFTKIYTSKFDLLRLSASNNRLAIAYNGNDPAEGTEDATTGPSAATLTLIDSSGKAVSQKTGQKAYRAVWSSSGKYLLAQSDYEITVYDQSLRAVKTLPADDSVGVVWLNDNEFIYGVRGSLWKANLASNQSGTVAQINGGNISELAVSFDGAYVYMSSAAGDKSELTRLGLKGQQPPKYLQTLSVFLPEKVGVCSLNYINFTRPTLTVSYPSSGTIPEQCVRAAKIELKYYGLDPNKFGFTSTAYNANY